MVTTLMISAKLATLGLLEIKLLLNKSYDVITYVEDVSNKTLSCDSNCIVDVVIGHMTTKFGNSNISLVEVLTSIL